MNDLIGEISVSNPGISFTEETNNKLLKMKELLENLNKKKNYLGLQELLIQNGIFSGSYCRSFLPFLYNCGFTRSYEKEFHINQYFTKYGESYLKILKSISEINSDNNLSKKTEVLLQLYEARAEILKLALINMKKNNYTHFNLYKTFLEFIYKYSTINKEEFYINQFYIQKNEVVPEKIIRNYRNETIKLKEVIGKESSELLNNPYTYCKGFLAEDQCKLVIKDHNGNYKINESEIDFIKEIIS